MAWAAVTWAFKELVTATKLSQMQENVRAHDHRPDGSQGSRAGRPVIVQSRGAVTSDAAGNVVIAHGCPVTPIAVEYVKVIHPTAAVQTAMPDFYFVSADATNVTLRMYRHDTNAIFTGNTAYVDIFSYLPT